MSKGWTMADVERNQGKLKPDTKKPWTEQELIRGARLNDGKPEVREFGSEPEIAPRVSKAAKTALPPTTMEQQLKTTEIMDAVACFSMGKNFKFVHYEHNRITATHQSGVTITITFK